MLAQTRKDKILEMLKEDGSVKVAELSKIFKVSDVTIRQDLEKLEQDRLVTREHGGAFLNTIGKQVQNFALANLINMDKKELIGKKAAEFIDSGDTIILDSGTTTTEIAKAIIDKRNITVITNAINIVMLLGSNPAINVILTGGEFKPPTLSLTGQKAADFFNGLHVDKLFLATAGISLKSGLTYPSLSDIAVKKAMIEAADKVYLVADSTKVGKSSLASLGALSLIHFLITDSDITEKDKEVFREHEIDFIIA
jgi:DeoR/GlpR family transcriptional regulator of sugar metabolism